MEFSASQHPTAAGAVAPGEYETSIVQNLTSMYQATEEAKRNEFHNNICELGKDKERFIKGMLTAFRCNFDKSELLCAAIYFKSFINNCVLKKELGPELRKSVFDEIIDVFFQANLDKNVIVNLTPCIETLLFSDESDHQNSQHLLAMLFDNMKTKIGENIDSIDIWTLRIFFTLFRSATNIVHDGHELSEKMKLFNGILCKAAGRMITTIKDAFSSGNQEMAEFGCTSLTEWALLTHDCMKKACKENKDYTMVDYLTTKEFLAAAYDLIFLGFPNEAVLFNSGNDDLDSLIYGAKEHIIRVLSTLISLVKPHLHMKQLKDTDFIKLLGTICPQFLTALLELGSNSESENVLENQKMRNCVTCMLTILSQMVYIKDFHDHYKAHEMRLFLDIGFPFLRTMASEKHDMEDNPAEFVKLALDVCDRQRYAQVKSQAAKFIETLVDKIDGIFKVVCQLMCQILEYGVLQPQNLEELPVLQQYFKTSEFFKYCSREDLIDLSMTVLTMVSYALPKDEELKMAFIQVLEKTTQGILEINSQVLKCRLTCLLGYYIDMLYKGNNDMFFEVMKMFITSLNSGPESLALAYQSSDTLNTIINDNDIIPRIRPIIGDLIQSVAPACLIVKIPDFFDFISEIFKHYANDIKEEEFLVLLRHLVKRIDIDVTRNHGESSGDNQPFGKISQGPVAKDEGEFTDTHAITKCWSIIVGVLENDHYISLYLDKIEEELKFLFGMMSEPKRIDFDDDIVKCMHIMISKSGKISETMRVLFPYLKNSYEKHKFVYTELFELIKAYCKTDKSFIFGSEENLQTVFGYGVSTLFNADHTCNGSIYLIQLFLMLKDDNSQATGTYIPMVLEEVTKRLQERPMNRVLKRNLFCIFLAAMVSNYQATFQYLEEKSMTEQVIDQILKFSVSKMDNPLERKLIAFALTNLLTQESMPDSVRDRTVRIISKIVAILNKTANEEARKARKKEKRKLEYKDDSDFDSDLDESEESSDEDDGNKQTDLNALGVKVEEGKSTLDEGNESTDSQEDDDVLESEIDIQSSFAIMKTGFNSFDEFEYFKFVLSQLYRNHRAEMEGLISQLSEQCQKTLKGLAQVQTFDTEHGKVHKVVMRATRRGRSSNN